MEHYESVIDLEENLEDYDSDIDVACRVYESSWPACSFEVEVVGS